MDVPIDTLAHNQATLIGTVLFEKVGISFHVSCFAMILHLILGRMTTFKLNDGIYKRLTHWGRVTHIYDGNLGHHLSCRLFGDMLLPEPMLVYYKMDPWEQMSVKF